MSDVFTYSSLTKKYFIRIKMMNELIIDEDGKNVNLQCNCCHTIKYIHNEESLKQFIERLFNQGWSFSLRIQCVVCNSCKSIFQ